jgi:hypothetical protein
MERLEDRALLDATPQFLPFVQNWASISAITVDDDWSNVPGILGFRGDDLTTQVDTDPQTILGDGSGTPLDVIANQTNPNTLGTGGAAEFHLTDPVVALQGSSTADAPFLLLHLNTTSGYGIQVNYFLRDIDGSGDNAPQQVALQYRIGSSGNFINVPSAYAADASLGPDSAGFVQPVGVVLPSECDNQPLLELRIMTTNAIFSDEWIGIDDIEVKAQQMGNDAFAGAAPIAAGIPINNSNVGATAEAAEPAHAGEAAQNSKWFQVTVAAGRAATVTLTPNNSFDAQLAVYTGTAVNNLKPVAAADLGAEGGVEQVRFSNLTSAAVTYAIAVDGFNGSAGPFTLNAVLAAEPANDAFSSPVALAQGELVSGFTTGATAENGEPDHAGDAAQKSVWYRLSVAAGRTATIQATPISLGFNAQLAIYTGNAVNGLAPVISANNGGVGVMEQVQFTNATASTVVYAIAVDGLASTAGLFNISAAIDTPPAAPSNDNFANAIKLTSGSPLAGTTANATGEAGEPSHAGEASTRSVWYTFTAPTGMATSVIVTPTSGFYDAQIAVYTGSSVSNLTLVTSADNAGAGAAEQAQFNATAGTVYAIAVDGFGSSSGTFDLSVVAGTEVNHAPTCTIGAAQNVTDEDAAKSIAGWVKDCTANDDGQTVTFSIQVDKSELFKVAPAVDENGTLTYTPAPNVSGIAIVTVTVRDDGGTDGGGVNSTTTQVNFQVSKARVWYNAKKSLDVTGEGNINASDALAVINFINSFKPQAVPGDGNPSPPYFDVNGNGFVAANDALAVINFINSFGPLVDPDAESATEDETPVAKDMQTSEIQAINVGNELYALLAVSTSSAKRRRG